jgi:hypothetical protein
MATKAGNLNLLWSALFVYCRQHKDLIVDATLASCRCGALLRAVYFELMDDQGEKNLKESVHRVDGVGRVGANELIRVPFLGGPDCCICFWCLREQEGLMERVEAAGGWEYVAGKMAEFNWTKLDIRSWIEIS